MDKLAAERPGDAVLSEEGADDPVRLRSERVWIVDPLDGTREFSELGRVDWAVHVALWQAGQLVAGAVALPAQDITLATPHVEPPPAAPDRPRIVVSRTRPPAIALAVRDALDGTLVEMGSAGPRWHRSCRAWPMCMSMPAGSSSGTRPPRWRWPDPLGCIRLVSTGRH
ncbi:3'-phosphoadenosine 5'-phosphate phosphatase [Mycobacterium ulcerans str. Harvey]|uniref:3'-phosphoadenosine 5'-phosphate phosphatase n=1 Tax=Mycobacterium ulcerans str. Harvey TaxID=1299332 RepID=A0ABN0QX51_MYCUL|nr:3'-phosphoadenosine 5'-phosphate phosphatase [Mycobacterium ulcerans str. Harvey]